MPQSSHQDFSRYGRVKYSQHVRVVESDATLLLQLHQVRRIHFCHHSTVICSFLFTLSKSSQASAASSPTAALLLITNCIHVCPWSDLDWGFGLCQCEKGQHMSSFQFSWLQYYADILLGAVWGIVNLTWFHHFSLMTA